MQIILLTFYLDIFNLPSQSCVKMLDLISSWGSLGESLSFHFSSSGRVVTSLLLQKHYKQQEHTFQPSVGFLSQKPTRTPLAVPKLSTHGGYSLSCGQHRGPAAHAIWYGRETSKYNGNLSWICEYYWFLCSFLVGGPCQVHVLPSTIVLAVCVDVGLRRRLSSFPHREHQSDERHWDGFSAAANLHSFAGVNEGTAMNADRGCSS